jgi:spore coat protein U-like protein
MPGPESMQDRRRHLRDRLPAAGTIGRAMAAVALLGCADARALDCLVSVTGVAFGVYDAVLTTPTDATGSLAVRCTHQGGGATRANYTVELSAGGSGTYAQRRMRSGASLLAYNLFDSATYTRVWGNGTGGSGLVAGSLLVNPGNYVINEAIHPIYGRIPAQQAVDSGAYSDTILVTLTF